MKASCHKQIVRPPVQSILREVVVGKIDTSAYFVLLRRQIDCRKDKQVGQVFVTADQVSHSSGRVK